MCQALSSITSTTRKTETERERERERKKDPKMIQMLVIREEL
jgi:hypothetical protein